MHTRGRKTLPKVDRDARRVDKKRGKGRSRYVFFLWEAERREKRSAKGAARSDKTCQKPGKTPARHGVCDSGPEGKFFSLEKKHGIGSKEHTKRRLKGALRNIGNKECSGKRKEDAWNGKLQKEVFIEAVAEKPDPPCVPEQVEKRDEHKRRFEIEKEEREREENGRGPKPRYCPDNFREKGGEEKEGEHENVFGRRQLCLLPDAVKERGKKPHGEEGNNVPDYQAGNEGSERENIPAHVHAHVKPVLHETGANSREGCHSGKADGIDDAYPRRSNFQEMLYVYHCFESAMVGVDLFERRAVF